MIRIILKLKTKSYAVMKWKMKLGNITTNLKVKIYITLPEFITTKIVMWYFHVDDSAKGRYYNILVRYLLTALLSNLKNLNTSLK